MGRDTTLTDLVNQDHNTTDINLTENSAYLEDGASANQGVNQDGTRRRQRPSNQENEDLEDEPDYSPGRATISTNDLVNHKTDTFISNPLTEHRSTILSVHPETKYQPPKKLHDSFQTSSLSSAQEIDE